MTKKMQYNQTEICFDFTNGYDCSVKPPQPTSTEEEHHVFPTIMENIPLTDAIAKALTEMNEHMKKFPRNISTLIFDLAFVQGLDRKQIKELSIEQTGIALPTRERIRQITETIAEELRNGIKSDACRNVKFQDNILTQIKKLRTSSVGMFFDHKDMTNDKRISLQGISLVLAMNIIGRDTVLPMLKGCFLLNKSIAKETFKRHYLATFQVIQEYVRPMTLDLILKIAAETKMLEKEDFNRNLVELSLQDTSIFISSSDEEGNKTYMMQYEHLCLHQQMARIIYELKSISLQQLLEEASRRGTVSKSSNLHQTRQKYPWCVPMGKTLWLYREDEKSLDRIQDVIKEYCEEHITFTFDEIETYLQDMGYNMIETSLRSYIMHYCRRMNTDRNKFRLTTTVPHEEDMIWHKRARPTTRSRKPAYRDDLIKNIIQIVSESPQQRIPRAELKNRVAPFYESIGLNINNIYKLLNAMDELRLEETDGTVYVTLKKKGE